MVFHTRWSASAVCWAAHQWCDLFPCHLRHQPTSWRHDDIRASLLRCHHTVSSQCVPFYTSSREECYQLVDNSLSFWNNTIIVRLQLSISKFGCSQYALTNLNIFLQCREFSNCVLNKLNVLKNRYWSDILELSTNPLCRFLCTTQWRGLTLHKNNHFVHPKSSRWTHWPYVECFVRWQTLTIVFAMVQVSVIPCR